MVSDGHGSVFDFRPLIDASRALLGYFVHTWLSKYLELIVSGLRRLVDTGVIRDPVTPTDVGRHLLFDFGALDMERLSYAIGVQFYVLSAHKLANRTLMNRQDHRQVLYLRGYDYEGSVATGAGMAMGFSSLDTQRFGWKLRELLGDTYPIFKVMSPKDVYWETVDAQRYFHGDFNGMIRLVRQRPRSVYLNALYWKEGVRDLMDRMDHFVVYVSSITESALWEIEQLDTDERRDRVTVVFDERTIENKTTQLAARDAMRLRYGEALIWAKEGDPPTMTATDLRKQLETKFLVTSPSEFEVEIDRHRARIAASAGPRPPGQRETWIECRWHPALPDAELDHLHAVAEAARARVERAVTAGIESLPLMFSDIQFTIFMSLLLGDHAATGRALAAYEAVMQGAIDYYEPRGPGGGGLSTENRDRLLGTLRDHQDYAAYAGVRLLGYGRSHEFEDRSKAATAEIGEIRGRTKAAVDRFFAERGAPLAQ
jgi:hypothetical protein